MQHLLINNNFHIKSNTHTKKEDSDMLNKQNWVFPGKEESGRKFVNMGWIDIEVKERTLTIKMPM